MFTAHCLNVYIKNLGPVMACSTNQGVAYSGIENYARLQTNYYQLIVLKRKCSYNYQGLHKTQKDWK